MSVCAKCASAITNSRESITCVECKGCFHPTCSRIGTLDSFKKLSAQRKGSWKCDTCVAEVSSCTSRNSDNNESSTLLESIQAMRGDLSNQISSVMSNIQDVKSEVTIVKESLSSVQQTLETLLCENELRKGEYGRIAKENEALKTEMSALKIQVRELEQYSRRDNIEIVAVPYTRGENLYSILQTLAKSLGLTYYRTDISTAHRLAVSADRPNPPIIVRFVSRDCKEAWISAAWNMRKALTAALISDSWPSTNIYINDHLTSYNKALLGKARQLMREKKIVAAWTRGCRIFVRKSAEPGTPPTIVNTPEDLDSIVNSK